MKKKFFALMITLVTVSSGVTSYGMDNNPRLPKSNNWVMPDGILSNEQVEFIVTHGLNHVETIAHEYRKAMDNRVEEVTHKTTQALENIGRALRISTVGLVVGVFGVKLLYDGLYEMMDKLEREENNKKRWWNVLTKKDYLKSTFGAGSVIFSIFLIIKSDSLAKYVG